MTSASLRRLILTFKDGEIVIHTLYQASEAEGLGPNTKKRLSATAELARQGLHEALESLGHQNCTCVGTSGFTQREDILLVETPKGA